MSGTIFSETLRRNWRAGLFWGLGLALLAYFIMLMVGDAAFLEGMSAMFESLPPAIMQIFGASDMSALVSTEGFVSTIYFTYAGLVMAIYALLSGLNISANEEEAGILDLVLSLPVGRFQLILERYAAYVVISIGVVLLTHAGLLLGSLQTGVAVNQGLLLAGSINMLPMTLFMMAFTAALAVILRRRAAALGIAVAYLIASYFIDFLAKAVTHELMNVVSRISFFSYYDSQTVLKQGLVVANVLVLAVALVVFVVAALYFFKRRDIAV
jgi:ABC-2 type transport system permease protein